MQKITFATNTSPNTLEHTKLLLKSLKENLVGKEHEILVFIDKDNDGTYEYLKSIKKDFYDLKIVTHKLKIPVGYQLNSNLIVDLAKYDIVSYLQSDMIISKNYDQEVLSELEENTILSSTRIEPPLHGESALTFTKNFGLQPEEFKWEEFLSYAETVKSNRSEKYFFAPYTFHKKTWQSIGGYDSLFRRAREDSDFVQRCVHAGIKLKQTFKANVYHFTCVSSRGHSWFDENNKKAKERVELQKVADGIELRRFIKKWGNFNHGETKLEKLDIDLVVKDNRQINPMFIMQLEPFFSRVWLKTPEERDAVLELVKGDQDPANKLLDASKEDWEIEKRFFNTTDFNEIYKLGEPQEYNIKIELDFTNVDPKQDPFLQNITNLSSMIEPSEPGFYELGCAKIDVKNVVKTSDLQVVVKNPKFDYSMLNIE